MSPNQASVVQNYLSEAAILAGNVLGPDNLLAVPLNDVDYKNLAEFGVPRSAIEESGLLVDGAINWKKLDALAARAAGSRVKV